MMFFGVEPGCKTPAILRGLLHIADENTAFRYTSLRSRPMKLLRSIGAILAGYIFMGLAVELIFLLSGRNPHAPASARFIIVTTLYGTFCAAIGGYVTSRLAGRFPLMHAAVLACLVSFIALISLFAELGVGSIWSQLVALLFMAPAVMIGAMLRLKTAH